MKTTIRYILLIGVLLKTQAISAQQTTEELTNLLIEKHLITESEADSLRAESALKKQQEARGKTKFPVFSNKQFSIGGYAQVRYLSQQEAGKADGIDIRRAYLDFKGLITEHWDYRLQMDFAGGPRILDAIIAYKYRDWLQVSAGQFKIPFSGENITPNNKLETIDRSQVVEAMASNGKDVIGNQNGRDIGVQISGGVIKTKDRFFVDYALGVFDGAGINTVDNNESKDISGRIIVHPFKNFDVGGSYYNGFDKWGVLSTNGQVRNRCGAELGYAYRVFNLKAEYIRGVDGKIKKEGWYGQASTFIYRRNLQLVIKYDFYNPNIAADVKNDTSVNYVFGVNLYFNEWIKLQVDYTWRVEENKQINNDLIAAQLQVSF